MRCYPIISVIVPLYNKEDYIKYAISSIINQTYRNLEIIVVNDGSTDTSAEKVNEIGDDRILLINQPNYGVSIARNNGIRLAKSEWIAFLDADDWWGNTFLEELVNLINAFPDNEIFATGRSRVFKTRVERYINKSLPAEGATGFVNYFEVISNSFPPLNSSCALIKKKILLNEEGPFNPHVRSFEDHDLWMRLCKDRPVVFINKNLSFYRKDHTNSASQTAYKFEDFITYLDTIYKVKQRLKDKNGKYFAKYYTRFILINFANNYELYSKEQANKILNSSKRILKKQHFLVLKTIKILFRKNVYKLIKNVAGTD